MLDNFPELEFYRAIDAIRVNEIVNHPEVYPWIKGAHTEPLDLTGVIENKNNVALVGEHGCIIFIKHQAGIYECHTNVLPSGRGKWVVDYGMGVLDWMFTKTDCYEILTKCPRNNVLSALAARKCGFTLDFPTRPIWPVGEALVPVDVYSIRVQEWVRNSKYLINKGKLFHNTLEIEYNKSGKSVNIHPDDEIHDRYVGASVAMIEGGQIYKAIAFYNRWAVMSAYKTVSVVSNDPLIIDIADAKLKIFSDHFEVV